MSFISLVTISIIGWGLGAIAYKMANTNIDPFMVSAIGTLLYVIVIPFEFTFIKFSKELNYTGVICSILGAALMAIGSLAYMFLLKKEDAGTATFATSLYPSLTLLISYLFLHEQISFRKGVGIFLALLSFWFLSKK